MERVETNVAARTINVNGKDIFVHDERTFEEVLDALGIDRDDLISLLGVEQDVQDALAAVPFESEDDYFLAIQEPMEMYCRELRDEVLSPLRGDGRKRENRRDYLARKLDEIVSNMEYLF